MTKMRIKMPKEPGSMWSHTAADGLVGQETLLKTPSGDVQATITDAEVVDEGTAVMLTFDIPSLDVSGWTTSKGEPDAYSLVEHHNVFEEDK